KENGMNSTGPQPKNQPGSEGGGWLKRLFGGAPKGRSMLDEVEEKGSKLIVQGYRGIASKHGCAPTSKTSDAQIVEIYKKVGSAFRQTAAERQEHLAADSLNYIVLKFFQVY